MKEISYTFTRHVSAGADQAYDITKTALPELIKPIEALRLHDEERSGSLESGELLHYERCWGLNLLQPLPAFVGRLIPLDDIKLDEVSDWSNDDRRAAFTIHAVNYPEVLQTCHGTLHVHDDNGGAELEITVRGVLELSNLSGLPGFVARRLENQAEEVGKRVLNTKMDRAEEILSQYINSPHD